MCERPVIAGVGAKYEEHDIEVISSPLATF